MIIRTIKDVVFWNDGEKLIIPMGTQAMTLSKDDIKKIDDSTRRLLEVARRRYDEKGVKGVFCFLKGKYRFLNEDSYEVVK